MGCISFTLSQRCVNITKAISYSNCIRTRSSGDRAPPSGGGSGGSNPPGCVLFLLFLMEIYRNYRKYRRYEVKKIIILQKNFQKHSKRQVMTERMEK